ncbi:MAG: glycoside hydrolase family 13 protein [Eubacteriales bacterium]|jgi:glycosidase
MDMIHDSACSKFRNPLGALATGGRTLIRLQAPNDGRRVNIVLFWRDERREEEMEYREGMWQYHLLAPQETGVLWYHFAIYQQGETRYYGVRYGNTAGVGQVYQSTPMSFQLTVYQEGFETPQWFRHSTMYQIFPDRFCRGDAKNMEKGAEYHRSMGRTVMLHENWEESPLYGPLPGREYYDPCDFFGGDLKGIEKQLPYLKELGVTCLYLNPIVEAASNHRYDTANYKNVDPILGTVEDAARLFRKAKKEGINILLDGVYSHTGSDSVYFNKRGNYPGEGAYQGKQSPYYKWYSFGADRDTYKSWWGFDTLPEVNETEPDWQRYVIDGPDSVFAHWLGLGASGFRLDVADELPDEVIEKMRTATKLPGRQNVLLGEVWEDATIKESYGVKRQYALGRGLDSVMNYPFRNACAGFLLGYQDAHALEDFLVTQQVNYPRPMHYCLMNLLSSHDIPRIRTVLAAGGLSGDGMSREEQAGYVVSHDQDVRGARLTRLAEAVQFTVPGVPSIYYGDEYGMHGLKDPFNRGPFVKSDFNLHAFTQKLSQLRRREMVLRTGHCSYFSVGPDVLGILRFCMDGRDVFGDPCPDGMYVTLINRSHTEQEVRVDLRRLERGLDEKPLHQLRTARLCSAQSAFWEGREISLQGSTLHLYVPPMDFDIVRIAI